MKILAVLTIVGALMLPMQEAAANYGSSAISKGLSSRQVKQDAGTAYRVKNRQQATKMLKANYRAKVLSVKATKVNGNAVYVAKLLGDDGVVFYVYIDAKSGQMRRR